MEQEANNSFDQQLRSEDALLVEKEDSVISETSFTTSSSHKMKIDELNGEAIHQTEPEYVSPSIKPNSTLL